MNSEDRQAIIDVTIAYTWALDTRDFQALHQVFAPGATASLRGVECNGVDEIIARISGALLRIDASQHMIGNHQVLPDSTDSDRATCRCHLQSQHIKNSVEGSPNYLIGGVYEDEFARTAEGWRISHRIMRQVWADGNEAVVRRT